LAVKDRDNPNLWALNPNKNGILPEEVDQVDIKDIAATVADPEGAAKLKRNANAVDDLSLLIGDNPVIFNHIDIEGLHSEPYHAS